MLRREPLLAIETTGRALSVATDVGGEIVCERFSEALSHLTDLIPTVSRLLASEGASLESIAAIAVSAGPGSFTGIRIGVSAARAMAQVTGLPVIKVPTLETFAYGFAPGMIVCPMLDARREQWYCGAYRLSTSPAPGEARLSGAKFGDSDETGEGTQSEIATEPAPLRVETLVPGAARALDDFNAELDSALDAAGIADASRVRYVRDEDEPQSAIKVLEWARAFGNPGTYTRLEPVYMRKAEAQRRLEERLRAGDIRPSEKL
jgi:tRNA threonylcarbamoyladenosine biosynthesis protein TsaB